MGPASLRELYRRSQRAWPGIDVSFDAFAAHVKSRAPSEDEAARLHVEALYLACACAAGDVHAIAVLEATCFGGLTAVLARLDTTGTLVDEAMQRLRVELFTSAGGRAPKIAAYSGTGDLTRWLRVLATRIALKLRQRTTRELPLGDEALVGLSDSPELALLRARYGAAFQAAVHEALRSLSHRQRTLLRQHALDGLGVTELGAFYGVHRATAARWVADATERLVTATRRVLMRRLGIDRGELSSVLRFLRTNLDLSLRLASQS
ncbi:MAG TPA: hypothetical protein VGQ83_10635 [Polyangia bacterium]|jgi:RNA polymerase sigma-70 factor (ECF subfamily)